MSWFPRILGEGLCYHVRTQCNNKDFRFLDDTDFECYLENLDAARNALGFQIHHYVLMHTHVHLILTTPGPALLDKVMHRINRCYAINYQRRHDRYGHFWMTGYRSSIIDTDAYALTCMRYLDRNPVRAGVVPAPADWPWSSHQFYATGHPNALITPHPTYIGLAATDESRRTLYAKFVMDAVPSDEGRDKASITRSLQQYGSKHPRSVSGHVVL